MALTLVDQGEDIALKALLNHTAGQNVYLKLFKSNTTPQDTDTEATYTEADFTGYAAVTLTGGSWTVSGGTASYAEQTFTSSAGSQSQNVYGYYIVQVTSGKLIIAERFSGAPYLIQNNGDNIKVTPQITAA